MGSSDLFPSHDKKDKSWHYSVLGTKLFNIKKPSIRTVVVTDPKTLENTPLNENEYYLFSLYRGQFIKEAMDEELKENKGKNFNKDWGTNVQKRATKYAENKIFELRQSNQ